MHTNLIVFLLLVFQAGFYNCAPSINPALQQQVDQQLSATPKNRNIDSPSSLTPMPLAVGQWIKLKFVDKKDRPSVFDYKIVGSEGDAFWIETKVTNYSSVQINKILTKLDRQNLENTEILQVITKSDDSDPTAIEGPALTMTKGIYKKVIQSMTVNWNSTGQEDITVSAGTFSKCHKINSKVSFGLFASSSTGFFHDAVPINGLVKSQSEDGNIELLDFGTSGATASF